MNPDKLNHCPSTLKEGFSSYSPAALRNLFYGRKVNHVLDFNAPTVDEEVAELFRKNSSTISISGAQIKQSLVLEKNKLRLTKKEESGHFILKPIMGKAEFPRQEELPANEHLTMQIAKQVYNILTAECGLIFFKNGDPAFVTRRFDYNNEDQKFGQDDFASLSGRSREINGQGYKNEGSYADLAGILKELVPAYIVEVEKLFERVIFNYLFSNGDSHLKNFSLQETVNGDYILSPLYDVLDTLIHLPNDSPFALEDNLFKDDFERESFKNLGFYAYDDFFHFGLIIGMREKRVVALLEKYRKDREVVKKFIANSFLSESAKVLYEKHFRDRLVMINNSFEGRI